MSKPKFVYVTYIASTPEKVFKALTSAEATDEILVRKCRSRPTGRSARPSNSTARAN